jgi:hypothetical protein
MNVKNGAVIVFSCFDTANSIELDRIKKVMNRQPEESPLQLSKPAPNYMQYKEPPVSLKIGRKTIKLQTMEVTASVSAIIFPFGTVGIEFKIPLRGSMAGCRKLSAELAQSKKRVEGQAREYVRSLLAEMGDAATKPNPLLPGDSLVVIHMRELDVPFTEKALEEAREDFAAILTGENHPLAARFQNDVLKNSFSYYDNDFLAAYSDTAILVDDGEASDALDVLQYALAQFVELRYFDSVLDSELEKAYDAVQRVGWLRSNVEKDRDDVAQLRLDISEVVEKIENSLKLVGDAYLARAYGTVSASLHLTEWRNSVSEKLQSLENVYQVLDDKAQSRRDLFFWILLMAVEAVMLIFIVLQSVRI